MTRTTARGSCHISARENTDVAAGRVEVQAALVPFGHSFERNGLQYTNIVCDGDSCKYLALCNEEIYGFIPLTKEVCINPVKRTLIKKELKGVPPGGRGGLTQELIKKLTTYYGLALRNNHEVHSGYAEGSDGHLLSCDIN